MAFINDRSTMRVTHSLAMSQELMGGMICVQGKAFGSSVSLKSDERVVVGRDPGCCNYTVADPRVSRKHMEITYVGALNKYRIVDYSSNGTFLQDGTRLEQNKEYYLPSGTELCLGRGNNKYKLR